MAGRKIEDEAEALEALDSIARTGLELKEWCRARDIDARSLAGWQGRAGCPWIRAAEQPSSWRWSVCPSSRPLGTPCDMAPSPSRWTTVFDEATLGRLLRVVAAC